VVRLEVASEEKPDTTRTRGFDRRKEGGMSVHHYHIHVFGQSFQITSEKSEDFVRTVAAYVDRKMRERATASHTIMPLRVAIMTALGIAQELLEKHASG
jgi:cell division protein ZapA (FtsZ GTPase activity inhibitor)